MPSAVEQLINVVAFFFFSASLVFARLLASSHLITTLRLKIKRMIERGVSQHLSKEETLCAMQFQAGIDHKLGGSGLCASFSPSFFRSLVAPLVVAFLTDR